jgi:hypothetical protein
MCVVALLRLILHVRNVDRDAAVLLLRRIVDRFKRPVISISLVIAAVSVVLP